MKTNGLKPIIGITLCVDRSDLIRQGIDYSYIRQEYGEQIKAAGGSPIFLDNTIEPEIAAEICDGIVISGGEDIHPSFYNQPIRHAKNLEPSDRTEWERLLIDACDQRGIRILGVCYGSQLLNVHYGGNLYQDIAKEKDTAHIHGRTEKANVHPLTFTAPFLGFEKDVVVDAACRHHQAVKDLGKGMEVAAIAGDGMIEAIAGNGHFGVQWHAEADGTAPTIYGNFVELVRNTIVETTDDYVVEESFEPGLA